MNRQTAATKYGEVRATGDQQRLWEIQSEFTDLVQVEALLHPGF
jgi:hypothetical protein